MPFDKVKQAILKKVKDFGDSLKNPDTASISDKFWNSSVGNALVGAQNMAQTGKIFGSYEQPQNIPQAGVNAISGVGNNLLGRAARGGYGIGQNLNDLANLTTGKMRGTLGQQSDFRSSGQILGDTARSVGDIGAATATAYGAGKYLPSSALFAGVGGGLQTVLNRDPSKNLAQDFAMKSLSEFPRSVTMAGVVGKTQPYMDAAVKGMPWYTRVPSKSGLNVIQGMGINAALERKVIDPMSITIDAAFPILSDGVGAGVKYFGNKFREMAKQAIIAGDESQLASAFKQAKAEGVKVDKSAETKIIEYMRKGGQQAVQDADLTTYEKAMNSGDNSTLITLSAKHADDARFQIHKSLGIGEPAEPALPSLKEYSIGKGSPVTSEKLKEMSPELVPVPAGMKPGFFKPSALFGGDDAAAATKMRGFPKTVKNTMGTPEEMAKSMGTDPADFYNPLKNKTVVDRVSKIISNSEDDALNLARTGEDIDANASAMLLIDKYLKNGEFDKANALIRDVSPRFTKQGQEVQILSLYGRLTPTGAVKFAQKVINDANKNLSADKQIKMTDVTVKKISDQAERLQKLPEGSRERVVAIAQLMDEIAAQVPPSMGQKIATLQTMAQLLNPKTAIRNIGGNTLFAGAENVSGTIGSVIDRPVSWITGQRSVTAPSLGKQMQGFKSGLKLGIEDAKLGINTGGQGTQFDLPQKTFRGGFLGKAEQVLNMELRAPDRAFYRAAYDESLQNQMRAAKVATPTDAMLERANYEGLYKTFQDDSNVASFLSGVKKLLNKPTGGKFGLGDFILKYPKTPGNIVSRGIDYSPAGFVKSVFEIIKPVVGKGDFDQREFVQSFSRALTGTGTIALAIGLAKLGLIKGKPNKDMDLASLERGEGQGPFSINLSGLKRYALSGFDEAQAKPEQNDLIINYDWLQPMAIPFSMGANMVLNPAKNAKDAITSQLNTALEGLQSGVDTLSGQPVIKQFSDFARTAGDPARGGVIEALKGAATNAPSSFVPSLSNQTGQLFDNTSRSTYDPNFISQATNKVAARIPGVRSTLEPNVDVFGNDSIMYKAGWENIPSRVVNVFLNPAFLSRYMDRPEAEMVLDIYDRSGETQQAPRVVDRKVKINGENLELQPEQITEYQRYVGTRTQKAFSQLQNDRKFQLMTDEEKAKSMAGILTDINSAAKIELFGNDPKNMAKDVRKILAGSLDPDVLGTSTDGVYPQSTGDLPVDNQTKMSADLESTVYGYDLEDLMKSPKNVIEEENQKDDRLAAARKIYAGEGEFEDFPEEQKAELYKQWGFDAADIELDYLANLKEETKTKYLISEFEKNNLDHDAILETLVQGRSRQLSGKYLVSDGVLKELYDNGFITSAEYGALKKMKLDKDGNPLPSAAKSGGSGGKSKQVFRATNKLGSGIARINLNLTASQRSSGNSPTKFKVSEAQLNELRNPKLK